jgi:hypothetical protein
MKLPVMDVSGTHCPICAAELAPILSSMIAVI